jgi:hypothetical protein
MEVEEVPPPEKTASSFMFLHLLMVPLCLRFDFFPKKKKGFFLPNEELLLSFNPQTSQTNPDKSGKETTRNLFNPLILTSSHPLMYKSHCVEVCRPLRYVVPSGLGGGTPLGAKG